MSVESLRRENLRSFPDEHIHLSEKANPLVDCEPDRDGVGGGVDSNGALPADLQLEHAAGQLKAAWGKKARPLWGRVRSDTQNSTGLTGRYEFVIEGTGRRSDDPADRTDDWPIDQLGLALKPGKVPGRMLLIDHVEKPTEN